jgi:hypothetical protein
MAPEYMPYLPTCLSEDDDDDDNDEWTKTVDRADT